MTHTPSTQSVQWSLQSLLASSQVLCQVYGQTIIKPSGRATDWDTDTLISHSQHLAKGYSLGI